MKGRPQLAYYKDVDTTNPLQRAVLDNNLNLVKIFLQHDHNLAYIKHEAQENTSFIIAAQYGFVAIAEEILKTCPDSVYTANKHGFNALHEAIYHEQPDFIDYIIRSPLLRKLINQASNNGDLALHFAANKCDPKLLRSLIYYEGQDCTAINVLNQSALCLVYKKTDSWKTLIWVS